MSFKTQVAADIANVFINEDEFATPATYDSADGSIVAKSILIIIDYSGELTETNYGAAAMANIQLKASDIPSPVVYDKITVDSTVFTVTRKLNEAVGLILVSCEANERQKPI